MEEKLKFLAVSITIFKVIAWISVAFFLIAATMVLFGAGGPDTPKFISILFIIGGAFYFLILYSISEALKVMVALNAKVSKILELLEGKSTITL